MKKYFTVKAAEGLKRDVDILQGRGPGGNMNYSAGDNYFNESIRERSREFGFTSWEEMESAIRDKLSSPKPD